MFLLYALRLLSFMIHIKTRSFFIKKKDTLFSFWIFLTKILKIICHVRHLCFTLCTKWNFYVEKYMNKIWCVKAAFYDFVDKKYIAEHKSYDQEKKKTTGINERGG